MRKVNGVWHVVDRHSIDSKEKSNKRKQKNNSSGCAKGNLLKAILAHARPESSFACILPLLAPDWRVALSVTNAVTVHVEF
jgi:hypothetical protein